MAQNDVLRFRDAITSDKSLKQEIEEAVKGGIRQEPDPDGHLLDLTAVVELAEQRGYSVTPEDLRAAVHGPGEGKELTDDELESVAGGGFFEDWGKGLKDAFVQTPKIIGNTAKQTGNDISNEIDKSVNPPGSSETTRHW